MSAIAKPDFKRVDESGALIDATIAARSTQKKGVAEPDGVLLVKGADLRVEPVSWLWLHWLALGKLHILAGAPGVGKTTLALAALATVTSGDRWPDDSRCEQGNVLVWSGEDDPGDTLAPRLIAMGADMNRVFFVKGARVGGEVVPFDPARDLVQLTASAMALGDIRLVLVDPVVSAVTGDSHKNTEVRRALQPLVDLAAHLGAAVLGISHFSKGGAGKDPTERVVGSVAFSAVARIVMVAAKINAEGGETRRVLARSKSNIGPDDGGFDYSLEQIDLDAHPGVSASRIVWGSSVSGNARDLLAEADAEPDRQDEQVARSDVDDALRRVIGKDTVPSQSVLDAMRAEGFTPKQVRTARERVGALVKRSGFGKEMKTYWSLPHGAELPADAPPVAPSESHSCPVAPSPFVGLNGHECEIKGTNGAPAAYGPGLADDGEVY